MMTLQQRCCGNHPTFPF